MNKKKSTAHVPQHKYFIHNILCFIHAFIPTLYFLQIRRSLFKLFSCVHPDSETVYPHTIILIPFWHYPADGLSAKPPSPGPIAMYFDSWY
jgi:hypothetical protein